MFTLAGTRGSGRTGALVGGILGGAACLVVFALVFLLFRRQRNKAWSEGSLETATVPGTSSIEPFTQLRSLSMQSRLTTKRSGMSLLSQNASLGLVGNSSNAREPSSTTPTDRSVRAGEYTREQGGGEILGVLRGFMETVLARMDGHRVVRNRDGPPPRYTR